jgi:AcrR family transcriptional regulator
MLEHMQRQRRRDAAANDERVLDAARDVFAEFGAQAPVSAIARRAGVGMGTLYRRYPSKDDLLRAMLLRTLRQTRADAGRAMAEPDAWQALRSFLLDRIAAGGSGIPRGAPTFAVSEPILTESRLARAAIGQLLERGQATGVVRADINANDVVALLTMWYRGTIGEVTPDSVAHRVFEIAMDGLRAGPPTPLSGSPATWRQIRRRWIDTAGKLD